MQIAENPCIAVPRVQQRKSNIPKVCFSVYWIAFIRIRNGNAIQVRNNALYIPGLYLRNVNFNFVTKLCRLNNTVDNSLIVKNLACGNRSCAVVLYRVKE